jgi:hypothetical protein
MASQGPAPRTAWVGDDSAPLGTPLRIDEDGCALTAVSPRPHLQVPVDANVGETLTLSSDGCGATSSGGLLFSLADELQSLLLAKLQAKELLSLAKTCKRAREVIMEGLISDSIWEQVQSHTEDSRKFSPCPLHLTLVVSHGCLLRRTMSQFFSSRHLIECAMAWTDSNSRALTLLSVSLSLFPSFDSLSLSLFPSLSLDSHKHVSPCNHSSWSTTSHAWRATSQPPPTPPDNARP